MESMDLIGRFENRVSSEKVPQVVELFQVIECCFYQNFFDL